MAMATDRTFYGAPIEEHIIEWDNDMINDEINEHLKLFAENYPDDSFEYAIENYENVKLTDLSKKKLNEYRKLFDDIRKGKMTAPNRYFTENQRNRSLINMAAPKSSKSAKSKMTAPKMTTSVSVKFPNIEYLQFSSLVNDDTIYFRSLNPENLKRIGDKKLYSKLEGCGNTDIKIDNSMIFMDYKNKGTKPCNDSAANHVRFGSRPNYNSRFISLTEANSKSVIWHSFIISACWSACGDKKSNVGKTGYFVVLNTKNNMESGQQNRLIDLRPGADNAGMATGFSKGSNEVLAIDYVSDPDIIQFESKCVDKAAFEEAEVITGGQDLINSQQWDEIPYEGYLKVSTILNCGKGSHDRYILVKKLPTVTALGSLGSKKKKQYKTKKNKPSRKKKLPKTKRSTKRR